MLIRNVSPVGDLDVPLLRRTVRAGEAVEVSEDRAARLLAQDIWEAVALPAADDKEGATDDPTI